MKKLVISLIAIAVVSLGAYLIYNWWSTRLLRDENFYSGNGRLEATEINIAAKIAGKVEKVLVQEGDKVKAGQLLVKMQTNVLEAQLAQAVAKREQAVAAESSAVAKIGVQQATLDAKRAELERVKALRDNAQKDYDRYKTLLSQDAASRKHYEAAEASLLSQKAQYMTAIAQIKEAEAQLAAAKADAAGAKANILAAEAEMKSIQADIDDSYLKAPIDGRIQYRIAEPGEVLSAGGRAINMVDLTDVYMTFYLPEEIAGRVNIGADVRLQLDAFPHAVPAKVTYVAQVAQFTPKTVETRLERQKLLFRIKAHINRQVLTNFTDYVKTGLPGVAWVRMNDKAGWPKELWSKVEREAGKSMEGNEVVNVVLKKVTAPAKGNTK